MKSLAVKLANLIGEAGLYRWLSPGTVPVFLLHRVAEGATPIPSRLSEDRLRTYLRYLARHHFRVLRMDELERMVQGEERVPAKAVMFTIDDGFHDHHDVAARVFDEFGYPLNFFLITGLLDKELWPWDDQITWGVEHTAMKTATLDLPSGKQYELALDEGPRKPAIRRLRSALKAEAQSGLYEWIRSEFYPKLGVTAPAGIPDDYRPMSWDDARSLLARGHGVYPHTRSHRILSTLKTTEKASEIQLSRQRVQSELSYQPGVFAYPTGRLADYDPQDIENLKQAGFRIAFNTHPGYVQAGMAPYELPRFSLPDSLEQFRQIVNGFEAVKQRLRFRDSGRLSISSTEHTALVQTRRAEGRTNG